MVMRQKMLLCGQPDNVFIGFFKKRANRLGNDVVFLAVLVFRQLIAPPVLDDSVVFLEVRHKHKR